MKIETKFDLNENVWYMKDNKIKQGIILHCKITVNGNVRIYYTCKNSILEESSSLVEKDLKECQLYSTKKELIESL